MGSYSLVLSCVAVAVVAVFVVVFPSIIYCKSPAALSPQRGKLLVAAACEILIAIHRGTVHQWRGSTQPFRPMMCRAYYQIYNLCHNPI